MISHGNEGEYSEGVKDHVGGFEEFVHYKAGFFFPGRSRTHPNAFCKLWVL